MQIAAKHDFAAKLRQSTMAPAVTTYVEWQRAVQKARALGTDPPPMPPIGLVSINLDLTTGCNYRCGHCIDWDKLNTGVRYDDEQLFESLKNLIDQGLKSVILIGGGEPTIHHKFEETVHFLKARGIQIGVVTNGSRGRVLEKIAPELSHGDWIRLSLDSGTNRTFIEMHRPRNKGVSLENICAWVPRIRAANPHVQVGFSYIITWTGAEREAGVPVASNIGEIVPATKLALAQQFSYISFKPFLTRFSDGAEVVDVAAMATQEATLSRISEAVREAKTLETPDFRVLESTNLRVLMEGTWRDFTKQPKTCHVMAFRSVLSPLGVYHCPAKRGVENSRVAGKDAYTAAEQPGTRQSLERMLVNFDASKECAEVTCLYNTTNWWLEDLVQKDSGSFEVLPDRKDYYL